MTGLMLHGLNFESRLSSVRRGIGLSEADQA